MRVNITYSVELEEVQKIAKGLLKNATKDLELLFKEYLNINKELEAENEKKAVETIENCRKLLVSADHSLFDCQNILHGYQKANLQMDGIEEEKSKGMPDGVFKNG